tara:strand:+ start:732 stop:977 length:246 start_codon:yes stop_codon:yes gene_type:complete
MAIDKPIYFNVFRNETPSQKAPTHSWNKWKNDKDIILPAGEYDLAFFGNATRLDPKTKEMVDNPHFKISNPYKKDKDSIPF